MSEVHEIVTDADRRFFRTFGYVRLHGVLRREEVLHAADAMDQVLRNQRGGTDYDGSQSERATPLVDLAPDAFLPLLDDERILGVAESLIGADCLYTGSNDGNVYQGSTVWHIDGGSPHAPTILKLTFYCEDIDDDSGCLSVLPGSQHDDYFETLFRAFYVERSLNMSHPDVPGRTPVPSEVGDIIAFDHRLWHSSWRGRPGRRQFAFSFASFPRLSWEETWLQGYLTRINQRQGKRLLSDRLLETASPRRRAKIEKLYQMGL